MKKGISKNQLPNVLMLAIVNNIWGFHNEVKDYITIVFLFITSSSQLNLTHLLGKWRWGNGPSKI